MARIIRKAFIAFGIIAALLIIVGVFATLREPKFPAVVMPNPNGYNELLKASNMIEMPSWSNPKKPSQAEMAEFVTKNAEALKLARRGLHQKCRVPLESSEGQIVVRAPGVPLFENLAEVLLDEGKVAEPENRHADAADSYVTAIRVGQEIMRGGMLLEAMEGSSIERAGLGSLERLVPQLAASECRQIIIALDSADTNRETVQNIVHQEKVWNRKMYGWRYYMHPVVNAQARHRASAITEQSDRRRKLMIKLAAQAFEMEHGAKPKIVNDLVPTYLKAVPKDAFTGRDMTYPP